MGKKYLISEKQLKTIIDSNINESLQLNEGGKKEKTFMNNLDWGKTTEERNKNLDKYHTLKTKQEKEKFVKNIKKETQPLNEGDPTSGTNNRQAQSNYIPINKVINLGINLFKIGSSQININSREFQNALKIFKSYVPSPGDVVEVQGGASAVAGPRWGPAQNQYLANKRGTNFMMALKSNGITANFVIKRGVVGVATVARSREANAEQFVSFMIKRKGYKQQNVPAIDNASAQTQQAKPLIPGQQIKPVANPTASNNLPIGKGTRPIA